MRFAFSFLSARSLADSVSDSFPPTRARRAAREIAKSGDAVGLAACWARCRASSGRPRLTACWTLSSGRRCPTASRSVGRGVDAQSNFLESLGMPSGVRLGRRACRECAFSTRAWVLFLSSDVGFLTSHIHHYRRRFIRSRLAGAGVGALT